MVQVVIFTSNNARVVYTETPEQFFGLNYLVNPDLSLVKGVPPHFWKRVNEKVVPMNNSEQQDRMKHHEVHGVDNSIEPPKPEPAPEPVLEVISEPEKFNHWVYLIPLLGLALAVWMYVRYHH